MASTTQPTENNAIDKRSDVERDGQAKDGPRSSKFWLGEVMAAQKREKTWRDRGNKVVARFRDERDMDRASAKGERRANILWSNTEILKAALFQGLAKPDVRRKFPKSKASKEDRVARTAALVLERALETTADDIHDEESQIEAAIEDMLLPGRGVAWVVYDAEVSKTGPDDDDPLAEADGPEANAPRLGTNGAAEGQAASTGLFGGGTQANPETGPLEEITSQSVRIDHVYWEDYLCSAGRKDSDVWWKARGHDYSRDELRKYWPAHADKIALNVQVGGFESKRARGPDDNDTFKRARVWEVWDKSKKERVFVAEKYSQELAREDDPYGLEGFYPTVEPLYAVKTTSTLNPVPEYCQYQDQAEELDLITTRISRLIGNLKRRGLYDASAEGPDNQLSQLAFADDDQFLPYRGMAALLEKGGLKNVFQSEDMLPTIQVLDKLYFQRQALVQTIYEVTGISDVIRGASNPNETATAQRIKGQFGSLRLQKRQKQVQAFIRNLYRLKAEIIAEHFTREQLQEMTGVDLPTRAEIAGAKQQIASIQRHMQMAQQSQQQMQAYQQQMQQAQAQPPAPPQGAGAPQGQPPAGGPPPPQPPAVIPMPQIDPEQMQALYAMATGVAWEDVAAILRSDKRRAYRVDIETDNTSQVDNDAEKASRIEFLSTMQGFMERVVPAIMQAPALAPLAHELVMFGVGAFKVGRTLEDSFNDCFDQLEQMAKQNAQNGPPPDPKAQESAAKAKAMEADTQIALQTAQRDSELAKHDAMLKERAAADNHMATQAKVQAMGMDVQGKAQEREAKAQEAAANFGIAQQEARRADSEHSHQVQMDHHAAARESARANADIAVANAQHQFDIEKTVVEHHADMQQKAWDAKLDVAQHDQKMAESRQKMINERIKAAQPPPGAGPRNGRGH